MASEALYEQLAQALSQPSRAYRAAQAGFGAVDQGIQGYLTGQKIADSIRQRNLLHQTLGEIFGPQAPQGTANIPLDQAEMLTKPVEAYAALERINRPSRVQAPGSLDAILADKVNRGEMTFEAAVKIKQSMSPSIFPKPEAGFKFGPNGELIPIPGGTPARKIAEEEAKKQAGIDAQKTEADLVIKKIDDTLNQVNSLSAGGMAGTAKIPLVGQMTGATDLSSNLDTITSSLGLNKLMEMKSNSKAGASGMGQLSDREMTLLTSALTSVKQSQSPEQLRKHLGDVKRHYQNILKMNQGVNPFGLNNPPAPNSDNKSSSETPPADPLGIFQ